MPLTEGEGVSFEVRETEPVTDAPLEGDTVPDGEREEEPHGEALAHAVPVGGRGVADTEGLVDTVRVAPPVEDREGLLDPLPLPLAVGAVLRDALADKQPEEEGDTVALAVALATALPLRLPLPLLDTLLQPALLTDDGALPESDLLLRMVLDPDGLVDAERDTLWEPLALAVRMDGPQDDTVATPARDALALADSVEKTEGDWLNAAQAEGLCEPLGVRDTEGEGVAEGDTEAERQGLGLPVSLMESRVVEEGLRVPPVERVTKGLADTEADTPAVRLAEGQVVGDAVAFSLREGEAQLVAEQERDDEAHMEGMA